MSVFNFNHAQIFYHINGEGIPIVLLHGFCEDHRVWEPFYDVFRSHVLENISCPVLCIAGKEDLVVPLEKSLQFATLPNTASIPFLPKVAHMGMFEAPDLSRKILSAFISFCQ